MALPITLAWVMGVDVAFQVGLARERSRMYAAVLAFVVRPATSAEDPPTDKTCKAESTHQITHILLPLCF